MKNCQDFKDMISEYVDDELKGKSLNEFEEHIKKCSECRKDLEDFKTLISYFRKSPEEDLPLDFKDSLHKKLLAESNINSGSSQRVRYIRKYMPICAAAASVIIVFAFWMNFKGIFKMGSSMEKTADSSLVYQIEVDSSNDMLADKKDSKIKNETETGNYNESMKYGSGESESKLDFGPSYKDKAVGNEDSTNGVDLKNAGKAKNYSADKSNNSANSKQSDQSKQSTQIQQNSQTLQNTHSKQESSIDQSPSIKDTKQKVKSTIVDNVVAKTTSVIISNSGSNTVEDIRVMALSYGALEEHPDVLVKVGESINENTDASLSRNSQSSPYTAALQQPGINKADEPVTNDSNSSVSAKTVTDFSQLSFSIPNDKYSKFIEKIKENYGASNIKISTPVDVDNTEAVNSNYTTVTIKIMK